MVCREAQVGSAVTSYVIQTTGLEEQQVLSLYHEVMRDGREAAPPTTAQQAQAIAELSDAANRANLSDARRRSILSRLNRAASEPMNGQRYYSTSRLVERAHRAERALNEYIADTARDLGITETEARARLNYLRTQANESRALAPSRGWVAATRNDPNYSGMPLDRQTAYAVETLNAARATTRTAQPTTRTVTREPVNSSAIAEMGYDPQTGRVEVVLNSNPDVPYAYRMTQSEYDAFRNSSSVGSYFATRVRGNPQYQYADNDAATADGVRTQCASCGQFEGASHSCPPRDSVEERNRTERRARHAARAARRTAAPTATPTADTTTDEPVEPVRLNGIQRRYNGESGMFRTTNLTEVLQTARRGAPVSIPVAAVVSQVSGVNGPEPGRGYSVVGRAEVTYNGRGRGYTVEAVTNAGDTGNDRLACTCPDYRRNYDCVHVRQTVQDLNTRLNQSSIREPHAIGEAVTQVTADLAGDRAESIAAQTESRSTWGDSPVSYTDDPAAFQAAYDAAKARQRAGEQPVPYMTENATDGLGARGTGRAFGVELEFDVAPGNDHGTVMRAIGRDLHAAGLTRSANQTHYHAASARGYTENHRGGWSFESDCTVAGEIVSPIMYDEPETWENLQKVCDIVKRNGGTVTNRTGGHIHVSAHNYDHTVENHNRLLGSFAENEDLIYRLSSNPDRGTHRGPQWCAPNRVASNGYSSISEAQMRHNSHGLGLNMQSVSGRESDHIEFRTYDASLEPSVIQTQIKMSLGITEAAFRDTDYQPGAHRPLGSSRATNRETHGASRRLTGDAWRADTAGFRSLADRIFRRSEDKAQFAALFAVTKWQRGSRR